MRFLRDNGLTIALMVLFLASLCGMLVSGWSSQNEELAEHGAPALSLLEFFLSGSFMSALFENWESEFLQMATYVILTAFLIQRGSAESKDPDGENPEDEDPAEKANDPDTPWPVRAGGAIAWLYSYSLGLTLALLFLLSFVLHWLNSLTATNEEALLHGQDQIGAWEYLFDAQFWFESFQNWQSEFLSTALLVVLSIFLRHHGSPESKPVAAPIGKTGH